MEKQAASAKINSDLQILTVITPFEPGCSFEDIFYRLNALKKYENTCFLDSSLIPDKYSRFSYLAWEPEYRCETGRKKNRRVFIPGGTVETGEHSPMNFLRNILNEGILKKTQKIFLEADGKNLDKETEQEPFSMPDFTGGFIGYFSYDLKNNIEKLPSKAKKGLHVPLFCFNYYLKLIYYDHVKNKCFFIKNYLMPLNNYPDLCVHYSAGDESSSSSIINIIKDDLDRERQRISACIKNTAEKPALSINQAIREKYIRRRIKKINPVSDFSREGYMEAVKKAKKYIRSGDIYQVNMTQRFSFRAELDPADLYYVLRQKNPAPFSAFISFPGIKIGCSSPERFLFLKDGIIETRPIKGTCQRGRTQEEDLRNMEELSGSIKDRAELNMIVDLERNDLGRFCRYGTVKVKEHAVVEKYAKVFHLVSTVTGSLQPGYSHADIIRAAFPGGSITGAPKIRAMEIIDELEPCARNIYTGSIGYIGIDGTMDLNIVIRSFIIKGRKFYYNVGGGIVADSVPETEFQETLDKGAALKETLDFFQGSN